MKRTIATLALIAMTGATVTTADAGYRRWSSKATQNPFSGGMNVDILYVSGRRSQIQVGCKSNENGVKVTILAGWDYSPRLAAAKPKMRVAIDGSMLLDGIEGSIGSYGQNIAGMEYHLKGADARSFIGAISKAQRQIAIEDGASSSPHLLTARGSTKSASNLAKCYNAQN